MAPPRPQTRARQLERRLQKLREQMAEAQAALDKLQPAAQAAPPPEHPAPPVPAETFAKIFQASPTLMAITELDTGRYVDVNEAFGRTLGLPREAVIGRTALELNLFVHPEQRAAAQRRLQADGQLRDFEVAVRSSTGEILTGLFAAEYIDLGDRRLLLTMMEDITERRRAAAALQANEAKFRSYVENAPQAIFVADRTGRYVDFNPAALDLLGYSAAELSRLSIADIVDEADAENGLYNFAAVMTAGYAEGDFHLRHRAGHLVWVALRAVRLSDDRFMAFCQDVMASRAAEEALRASEARYRLLAEHMADVVWVLDTNTGRFTYVSPSVERLRGYTVEEVLAQRMDQVMTPASLAMIQASLPQRLAAFLAGDPAVVTQTHAVEQTRRDGSTVWTEVVTTLLHNPAGGVDVLGVSRDISARRRAEQALADSEARYRGLFENMLEGFAYCRMLFEDGQPRDWVYLTVNRAFETLTGLTGITGRKATDAIPGLRENDPELFEIYGRVAATGRPERFETFVAALRMWFSVHVYSPQAGDFVAVFDVVTERKLTETRLRTLAERLDLATRSAGLGIWEWDIQKNELIWDDQMYALYGVKREDFQHDYEAWVSGLHPDDRAASDTASRLARSGEKEYDTQFRVRWPDGTVRVLQANAVVVRDAAGQPLRMVGVNYDITERMRAEAALRESEAWLRLANEAAGLGAWRHDLRTGAVYLDQRAQAHYGFTAAEVALADVLARVHPDDRERLGAEIAAATAPASDGRYATEYRVVHPDGSEHWLAISVRVQFEGDGDARRATLGFGTSQDITARKQAEAALRESEAKYRALYEGAAIGIFHSTFEGRYLDLNPALARMLGYGSPAEVLAAIHDVAQQTYVNPERREVIIAQLLAQGGPLVIENRYHRRNGPDWDAHLHLRCVTDPDGRPRHLEGFVEDITERKRAEAALRESEARYRGLIDNAPDAVFVNREGRLTLVNAACLRLFGAERPEQLLGRSPFDLIHPDDRAAVRERIQQMVATGRPVPPREQRMLRLDGSVVEVEASAAPFRDQGQAAIHVNLRDITERRRAEAALRESEGKLQAVIESLPVGVSILDAERRVVYANRALERVLKLDQAQLVQGAYRTRRYFNPDRTPLPPEAFPSQRVLREGRPVTDVEVGTITETGGELWTSVSAVPLEFPDWRMVVATVDVTALRQAEERSRRGEQVLRLFVEHSPAAIAMFDRTMTYIVASRRYLADYRLGGQDLVGRSHYDIFPEIPERWKAIHRRCQAGAVERCEEDPFPRADGRLDWVRWEIRPWYESDGQIGGVILFSEVITARKESEAALRQSEERFGKAFQANPGAMSISRLADGQIIDVNASYEQLLGYSRAELVGRPILAVNIYDDPADRQNLLTQLRDQGAVRNRELTLRARSGARRQVLFSLETIELAGEACLLAILYDITERKLAEAALRQSEENFSKAFRSSPTALLITRLADGRYLELNDAYCAIVGFERRELLGRLTTEFNIFVRASDRQAIVQRLLAEGSVRDFELDIRHRSGALRHVVAGQEQITFNGEACILSTLVDITDRKRIEDELRRSNAELEQFAYVASHDLQEPLRGMAGMVQLLQQLYQGRLDERADELIGHAVDAAGRMQALINDLLAYSRVGRRGGAFTAADTGLALRAALDNLAVMVAETGAVITPGPLPSVTADFTQLVQLFQNLVGNALKFRGERAPEVAVSAEREAAGWRFAVRDNGLGIEPQYFERIFQVFQRLHTRREYPGTGIGLALCKKIVERHGGRLWVESQPGQGSTFFFTLPDRDPSHDH